MIADICYCVNFFLAFFGGRIFCLLACFSDMFQRMASPSTPQIKLAIKQKLPLLWLALLGLVAVLIPGRVWTTILVGFGGLFLVAYWWAWQLGKGVRASRHLRFGWVAVGDRLSEQFEAQNKSGLPAFWVELVDESNVPGYRPGIVCSLSEHGTTRWRQDAICQRRGQFHLGPWQLRTGDPFGLFEVTIHYPISEELIIHPPIHHHLPILLPAGQRTGRSHAHHRDWQATINAATVRDYRPADPLRWIHWPTSAHRDQLFVRQFDLDATGDLWLLLDFQAAVQLGQAPHSTEEQAVLLAASLAAQALQQNRGVGVAIYGQQPQLIVPGRGQGQLWKILRALALVQADGRPAVGRALQDLADNSQPGAAALVLTANNGADWLPDLLLLSRKGVQPGVALFDRPSFGGQGQTQPLREMIQRLGFPAYVVRQGEIGQPVQGEARRGFWEFKTLATGKVVVVSRPGS